MPLDEAKFSAEPAEAILNEFRHRQMDLSKALPQYIWWKEVTETQDAKYAQTNTALLEY